MKSRRRRWVLGIVLVALALGPLAWLGYQWLVEPDPPGAFYEPPDPLPAEPPGSILRQEAIESSVPGATVTRVLYLSTDPQDRPIAVSGVVVAPSGTPPAGGWPVVAWAHGTTGVASRCAPSLEGDGGTGRIPVVAEFVGAGIVVVATDYPGLGTPGPHPYLVGASEGRAVLDSIRAAHALTAPGERPPSAVFGHSQGGQATLYAASLAPTYAPELGVVGAAAMAPPTDLASLLASDIGEVDGIVLTALALDSWAAVYGADVDLVVDPEVREVVERLGERCIATTEEGIADIPDLVALEARFLSANPADVPAWASILTENSLSGSSPITLPLLVSQGLSDTIVRPDVTTSYVDEQCRAGASISFDTYPGVGHFEIRTVAPPEVFAWLTDRLAGVPAAPGCSSVSVQDG